ncbi:MAG: penicillin acylase family protein, partial [Pseudomonadales bacterium]
DLTWHLNFGKTYEAAVEGLASLGTFPQNVMVADTSGNIYYQRAGRVPVRAQSYDWSRPVDGSTSQTNWSEFHPSKDQLQILNPPQGYMQNCNIPPDAMMVDGPFRLEDYLPEIYSSAAYGPARSGWIGQRAARALELLHNDDSVTVEEALTYALDVRPYGIDRWIDALDLALDDDRLSEPEMAAKAELLAWDGELRRDSSAAIKYAYFRFALAGSLSDEQHKALRDKIDQWYLIVTGDTPATVTLSGEDAKAISSAFSQGLTNLRDHFGTADVTYGDVFRVGRDDKSWPVGGGGGDQYGLTTLRTVGFGSPRDDHQRWGTRGQTSTQIVELSKPIKSWIYLPVGQSDRPASAHYTDQAEKIFSHRELKPSWWRPEELKGNIESRRVYEGAPTR